MLHLLSASTSWGITSAIDLRGARLKYFKRGVFALQREICHHLCFTSSFRKRCLRRTVNMHVLIVMLWWIYVVFMNQMLGIIHHLHCGSRCRIIAGDPRCDNNGISKSPFFFLFFPLLLKWLWNHCRIGFYCPGWWIICCIFLKWPSFFVLEGKLI